MLIVISPAKNLDYDSPTPTKKHTKAALLDRSQVLIDELKQLAPQDVSKLMKLSDKLGTLNFDRFQQWSLPFTSSNARQAVFAFNGDVYAGLNAYDFDTEDLSFAQEHLRILSGLYGVLKPLDLMQAYRLEMGTKFGVGDSKDLYQFWGDEIVKVLNKQLKKLGGETVMNLASNEYFKSVNASELNAEIITPIFKDKKNGQYKIISFYAKKARGRMSAYIIKNKITEAAQIKSYDWDGYCYNEAMSSEREWVFVRDAAPA
jgi:cytoplasmic iron level regulating protein YaaA (DUF328/UPF0246 family)